MTQFSRFVLARVCAAAGTSGGAIVVTFLCVAADGNSGVLLAQVLSSQVIGQLISTFFSGAVVDRYPRRLLMQVCYFLNAVVFMVYAALAVLHEFPHVAVVALAGVSGVLSGLVGPALQSVVPQLVPAHKLVRANGRLRTTVSVSSVVAPAVAGFALHRLSIAVVAMCVAAAYILASVVVSLLPKLPKPQARKFLGELVAGWAIFAQLQWYAVVSVSCALINMLWVAVYVTWGPVRAVAVGWGAAGWGVVGSCLAAGLIIGASIFGRMTFTHPIAVAVIAQAGKALPMLALFLTDQLWVFAASVLLAGVCLECFIIHFTSTAQAVIPIENQGKVFAVDAFVGLLLMPGGYWVAAFVEDTFGATGMSYFSIGAAVATLAVAITVAWWLLSKPQLKASSGL